MRRALALAAVALALNANPARADAPLPPPQASHVCADGGRFCADADPAKNRICISTAGASATLWCLPQWERAFYLSQDGEYLVAAHGGLNLIPLDSNADTPMLRFYHRAALVRTVTLGELFPDLSKLQRTVSHWHWGLLAGLDANDVLTVDLVDGRRLRYSARGGALVAPRGD